ncbi:Transcriptional regulator, GntR family, partial [Pseudomonas syringae pv. spinaceae]
MGLHPGHYQSLTERVRLHVSLAPCQPSSSRGISAGQFLNGSFMNDAAPALPRTLGESITKELRRMLVEGELVPGQRLSEAALADSLQISRNTLREAFRVLTREGLLTHVSPPL